MAKPKKSKIAQPLRLDLACGRNKQTGFTGVDLYSPDADIKCDLFKFPFKEMSDGNFFDKRGKPVPIPNGKILWKDNTVDEIFCSHFVEHIPATIRWQFFAECWRIMKLEATMRIFVPSWKSERAYGDCTHAWPPVTSFFFFYLNKQWREANKLTYGAYDIKCNFEHQSGPTGMNPAFADRNHETQIFACTHYLEAYPDAWITLSKKAL